MTPKRPCDVHFRAVKIAVRRCRGLIRGTELEGRELPAHDLAYAERGLNVHVCNWLVGAQYVDRGNRRILRAWKSCNRSAFKHYHSEHRRRRAFLQYGELFMCAYAVNQYLDRHHISDNPSDLYAAKVFLQHADRFADFEQLNV